MGLLSSFKRSPGASPGRPSADAQQIVAQARSRARRRLIGAVVLLGVGVIGFPLLFETQPRPIPVDIAIEIPRKDNAAPLAVPAPRTAASAVAPAITTESKAEAGRDVVIAAEPPAPKVAAGVPLKADRPAEPKAQARVEAKPEPKPEPKPESKPAATVEAKPAIKAQNVAPAVDSAGRFVVQVGAFADSAIARETRLKVEKLGLRTYTQVVQVEGGQRIRVRVGPFATRDEADKVAGKVKAAGLPSAVLTL